MLLGQSETLPEKDFVSYGKTQKDFIIRKGVGKNMGYKELKFEKDSVFLVTGAAGFIGSNLCEALTDLGYQVRALDDLSTGREENVKMFMDRTKCQTIRLSKGISRIWTPA